jgi:N-sulfoglucosamine sulfohydrolase
MKPFSRRQFLGSATHAAIGLTGLGLAGCQTPATAKSGQGRQPNILLAIADDWGWPHASIAGTKGLNTPNFDRVAREGVLFTNTFCAAPQCSPNRAALLTGRHIGQLEEAGTHSSLFPNKFRVYPDLLENSGYHVGYTGKGWDPGNWRKGGWLRNPAGPEYNQRKHNSAPWIGINPIDYAGNFEAFLAKRNKGAPFCFWYGGHEPHRKYEEGSGLKSGKKLEDVHVPAFLPDDAAVRSDMLDYFLEIEWFDAQLGAMLQKLEALGELENTLVVVTGDNGMSFPRAKANLYEYGVRVPLAIRWGDRVKPGRTTDDLISFVDLAPTLLDAAGVTSPEEMSGKTFLPLLTSDKPGPNEFVVFGRERHAHARYDNVGYPARAIRTRDHLYIRNYKPDRWPAGDPEGYSDIDDGPAKTFLVGNKSKYPALFDLAVGKRPEEELYAVGESMDCMENLAGKSEHRETTEKLSAKLAAVLSAQKDPRAIGTGDIFDSYPRFGEMRRKLGGFAEQGAYNPRYQPEKR